MANAEINPPSGIVEVLHNLIISLVDNPVSALLNANYIGILAWAIIMGIALRRVGTDGSKAFLDDIAKTMTMVVQWVIRCAPLGIMGLVAQSVGDSGLSALIGYIQLLGVLISAYFLVALVMNPAIVFSISARILIPSSSRRFVSPRSMLSLPEAPRPISRSISASANASA